MTLAVGTRLGPYEILAPLGAGGMGEVYRARDTRLGRDVAIKVLPEAVSADRDRLGRFEREARAASALNHPNILTIHDVGSVDGGPYVVSELLEGETLRQRLAAGPLSARKAVDFGIQIAHGLAAAHERGIVHRDLKPENVFVTGDGRVKILDFGLAKLIGPEAGKPAATGALTEELGTRPGVVMGTVGYMSPEQVRGEPADARSDFFAFGSVLYEMLTRRRAFRGDNSVETMNAILKEEPPEPSRQRPDVTPALDRVVRRCLEKSPSERFQSARDLGFALEEASTAASAAAAAQPRAGGRPRARLALALGAGLLLLAVLLAVNVRGLRDRLRAGAPAGPIQSLAVLPLENFSRDPEQEFFADGMTEELITHLAQIGALRVSSRTSAMRYKGTQKSVPEIARELNVDAVIEGSVLRVGSRVRITAQLIGAATDKHLWAQSYERDLRDVLALQGEVARAIAGEIGVTLTPQERSRLTSKKTVNPEAYEAYLKGRYHWDRGTAAGVQKSLEDFQQAAEKQPDFALAYAGIADAYNRLAASSINVLSPKEAFPKSKAAAMRAVELDPTLGEPYVSLAWDNFVFDRDFTTAESQYRRALELNPSYPDAHQSYASFLSRMGRFDEAIREAKRGQELDPISPEANLDVGFALHAARRDDEAIPWFRRVLDMDPSFLRAHWALGLALVQKGRYEEAIAELQKAVELSGGGVILGSLGYAYAVAGRRAQALEIVEKLKEGSRERYVPPAAVALVFAGLGEKDQAMLWLEKAYEERDPWATDLKTQPMFDSLRSDPRFLDLLRRVGLN
ncbi:MAG: protein kinase domain-containing protein [Thermoanaerobaculia bacterium]